MLTWMWTGILGGLAAGAAQDAMLSFSYTGVDVSRSSWVSAARSTISIWWWHLPSQGDVGQFNLCPFALLLLYMPFDGHIVGGVNYGGGLYL